MALIWNRVWELDLVHLRQDIFYPHGGKTSRKYQKEAKSLEKVCSFLIGRSYNAALMWLGLLVTECSLASESHVYISPVHYRSLVVAVRRGQNQCHAGSVGPILCWTTLYIYMYITNLLAMYMNVYISMKENDFILLI